MTISTHSSSLRRAGSIPAIALVASLFVLTPPAATQTGCTGPAGETLVAVDLIRDNFGNPVVETDDLIRSEYAHITSGLRDALGITVPVDPDPNDGDVEPDVRPQIRVIVKTSTLGSGLRSTALFTVEKVISDVARRVEIYDVDPGEPAPDEDSGKFKLFEAGAFDPNATLTVHAVAPSRTEVTDGGLTTVTQSFCEPAENDPADPDTVYGVFENVTLGASRDFVLLVPHGGMIEEGTSEQIAEIEAAFAIRNMTPSVWEAAAVWDSDLAAERFHITSKAIDPQSFPGLGDLLDADDWDPAAGLEFQHAASLHGFGSFDKPGIVFGGRAARELKCYVARRIQERLASESVPAIAFYVYDSDGEPANALDLPDADGVNITEQRPDVGLTGRSCENIVNRLTQDPGCNTGHGGIQIEESASLRDDPVLVEYVSQEIAFAFADMIEDPFLVDPSATVYCEALESAATGGPGQIGDTVWVDLDGDGVQGPGEPGREGVTVELLEDGLPLATAVTAANGRYLFSGLAPATYTVEVTLPAGFTFSAADQGQDDTLDSDVISGGQTGALVISPGDTRLDVDAGLVPDGVDAQVGDFAWQDENGDGVQDPAEPGLGGVEVDLATALGTPVASTVTDAAGSYLFTGLLPGDYTVSFTAPGWIPTTPATIGPFPLGADAVDTSRDAGFKASCEDFAVVAFGDEWTFPGNAGTWSGTWNQPGFDDSDWDRGHGVLGFTTSTSKPVYTTVPNGSATVTYYFRHAFDVADASIVSALDLEMERDDGAVVYLNGEEVFRTNMPAGAIDASTRAVASSRARVTASLDPADLDTGPNLLAVEIHQRFIGSDADFAFDLELRATSCDPCAVTVVELEPVADTYLRQDEPGTTKGGLDGLWADGDAGGDRSPLFAWDLSQVPSAAVLGAEIVFEVLNDSDAFYPLHGLETSWLESEATWNHKSAGVAWDGPGATGALDRLDGTLGVAHREGTGTYTLSLTAAGRQLVADWISGAVPNHGLIVAAGDHTDGLKVGSREHATPPKLRLVQTTSCVP